MKHDSLGIKGVMDTEPSFAVGSMQEEILNTLDQHEVLQLNKTQNYWCNNSRQLICLCCFSECFAILYVVAMFFV
jgi:hypothetical protein